jgi:hypothetical protein
MNAGRTEPQRSTPCRSTTDFEEANAAIRERDFEWFDENWRILRQFLRQPHPLAYTLISFERRQLGPGGFRKSQSLGDFICFAGKATLGPARLDYRLDLASAKNQFTDEGASAPEDSGRPQIVFRCRWRSRCRGRGRCGVPVAGHLGKDLKGEYGTPWPGV